MIYMKDDSDLSHRVHMVRVMSMKANTVCRLYRVSDGLTEVGEFPDCMTCIRIRLKELLDLYETTDVGDFAYIFRNALIDPENIDAELGDAAWTKPFPEVKQILQRLLADHHEGRELLTQLRLDRSLCPLHGVDYAICFDDDVPECAAIRAIHPQHDT